MTEQYRSFSTVVSPEKSGKMDKHGDIIKELNSLDIQEESKEKEAPNEGDNTLISFLEQKFSKMEQKFSKMEQKLDQVAQFTKRISIQQQQDRARSHNASQPLSMVPVPNDEGNYLPPEK